MSRRRAAEKAIVIRGPRILVVCGSERTESQYLRGLRDSVANRAVDVTLINKPRDPLSVVSYASIQRSIVSKDFDMVWCVFDVDQYAITRACELAAEAVVDLAVSNPCFELWLLLHFEDRTSHLNACAPAMTQ